MSNLFIFMSQNVNQLTQIINVLYNINLKPKIRILLHKQVYNVAL